MDASSFCDDFEFEVNMYNNRLLMDGLMNNKIHSDNIQEYYAVDIDDPDADNSFANRLIQQIDNQNEANRAGHNASIEN